MEIYKKKMTPYVYIVRREKKKSTLGRLKVHLIYTANGGLGITQLCGNSIGFFFFFELSHYLIIFYLNDFVI